MKRVALVLVVGVMLAGCSDPYERRDRGMLPPTPRTAAVSDSASAVARTFALHWVNWDWRSAPAQQRSLARLASGRLAADLRANAASARIDASLAREKPSVRGVVAIVQVSAHGPRGIGLVVTRERSYTAGRADLGGQNYRVYAITLIRRGAHWEVSAWQPQP